ncbi:MAG: hypothetical protein Ct9H90mP2_07920 [Dehalococcoidia bacterium]|nr:MAG: hypothetical protein Ct9H90mP2_07920 [Dehalococcoidia bacterium]
MHRSGFISQVSSGIFSFLPIGWRSIEKIKNIIREEMNNSGALEINMPLFNHLIFGEIPEGWILLYPSSKI